MIRFAVLAEPLGGGKGRREDLPPPTTTEFLHQLCKHYN